MENASYGNPYGPQQQMAPTPQQYYNQPRQTYGQAGNPYQTNQMQTPMMPVPMSIPNKISDFVQGELGATIFAINYCNQEAFMYDIDNENIVYRKSRDANGKMSPITKWKLIPLEEEKTETVNLSEYVKTDDVKKMISDSVLDLITETVEQTVQNEVEKRFSKLASPAKERD